MTSDELRSMAAIKRRIAAQTVYRNLALEFEDHAQTADRAADEIDRLTAEKKALRGAMEAQNERERQAGIECGVPYELHGCDWPDGVATEIANLKAENERLKAELSVEPTRSQMARGTIALAAERDALQARVAELERDAKRYRWLKSQRVMGEEYYDGPTQTMLTFTCRGDMDSAIDAALKAKP